MNFTIASSTDVERYGVAYHVQDAANYQLFSINPSTGEWLFADVTNGEGTIQQTGTIATVPNSLTVSGRGDYAQARLGDSILENVSDVFENGSLALYLVGGELQLESLQVNLVGPEARQAAETIPTPAAGLGDTRRFLRADIDAMLATNDIINSAINCPAYMSIYEGLERHLNSRDAQVRILAQETLDVGALIYSRCQGESPDAPLSFVFSTQDYIEWEDNLRSIQGQLEN